METRTSYKQTFVYRNNYEQNIFKRNNKIRQKGTETENFD